jgi:small basic protein
MRRILVTAAALVSGMALAQDVSIPTNVAEWFTSQVSLAAVVAALVALVRKHLWKSLDGPAVVGTSVALGVVLAYLGHRLGYLGSDWFTFGMVAGLLASGGVDALRGIVKGGGSGAPGGAGGAPSDADRVRLR